VSTRQRVFHPHGQELVVELLTGRCQQCGTESTSARQHQENLTRLAARKASYGTLLMGEEILALRRRYGLTQQQSSLIFGKGKIAFSRYETETTYPDESTTRLLRLAIEKPETIKWLADQAGIDLPLWSERCQDEQRVKLRPIAGGLTVSASRMKGVPSGERHLPQGAGLWTRSQAHMHVQHLELCDASNDSTLDLEVMAS
jgi:putative zinc finger/helix-turn-helix YgiT family protein